MIRTTLRALVSCLTVALMLLGAARAADAPAAAPYAVTQGDRIGAGGSVLVREPTGADVMLAGGSIRLSGSVGGDYLGAGGEQEIAGAIAGSVRAAGGEIRLRSQVKRNVTMAGGRLTLEPTAVVGGNAYLVGGQMRINGSVAGALHATGGMVVVNGTIAQDADVRAGRLHLGPNARIGGNLRHSVDPENVTMERGALVTGQIIARAPITRPARAPFAIVWHLGFLVAGAALIALMPSAAAAAGRMVVRPLAAIGYGALWLIGVPLAAALLMATVIGIPLAVIVVMLYVISLYLARAVVALWLGRLVLGTREPHGRRGLVLSFVIGAVVLIALGFLPVVGSLVSIAATLVGVGAAVLAVRYRSSGPEAP